ncbi:16S rRNA (guanine(527)-N(7))-methyltransferase RsmG [Lentibacter algarum]|uniref:16S rRNA (guanine(527)-N(7))-methyltransferase RsmG n=1 Tax=Lentibacter algarum TaxID=576131 RepID=UPI001C069F65|nr:16S rRNA (guanine(527)-N(7))-methyltransferase RsmG [Lentibacter algarum]MBU2980327.1 16S rRNA (guanine(527)-N(7))-methyltransferase RsmG [Lentibacter algarum]
MMPSTGVSRETIDQLKLYAALLKKWNPKINLVSRSTLDELWSRHIEDSLQLVSYLPNNTKHLVDMGSGGGFPGLVVAIAAKEALNPAKVTMIESDQRKAAFLRTVLRETDTQASLLVERVEKVPQQAADVITARALASLLQLFEYSERHLTPDGTCLFLKGKNWRQEINAAEEVWHFRWDAIESKTNPEAALLKIGEISRA